MLKVESKVPIYEINGQETEDSDGQVIVVTSHWNRQSMVVIEVNGGRKATVLAADLEAAITNATRVGK